MIDPSCLQLQITLAPSNPNSTRNSTEFWETVERILLIISRLHSIGIAHNSYDKHSLFKDTDNIIRVGRFGASHYYEDYDRLPHRTHPDHVPDPAYQEGPPHRTPMQMDAGLRDMRSCCQMM
jgi:hypothetical protein